MTHPNTLLAAPQTKTRQAYRKSFGQVFAKAGAHNRQDLFLGNKRITLAKQAVLEEATGSKPETKKRYLIKEHSSRADEI